MGRHFLSLLRKRTQDRGLIGVEFNAEGLAIARIQRLDSELPRLTHCDFLPCTNADNPAELLRHWLARMGLSGSTCNLVMTPGSYSLPLVETPKVAANELREALRWRIRDLIHFPVADAVIDAFLLPEDSRRGENRMAYVAAAEKSVVVREIERAQAARLSLHSIDIAELALGNLVTACSATERGVALVRLQPGKGSLQIVRNDQLYLSRQFELPYMGGLLDDLPAEELVLELQRSLDYFERQMRQSPPGVILLCGENVTEDKITPSIRDALPMPVDLLELEKGLTLGEHVQAHTLGLCVLAIGAALRREVEVA